MAASAQTGLSKAKWGGHPPCAFPAPSRNLEPSPAVYKAILLPIDLDQESSWKRALPLAVGLASTYAATLHLMTVVPDFGMSMVGLSFPADFEKKALAAAGAALEQFLRDHVPAGIRGQAHVAHGTIYSEIIQAAATLHCDLIVLASHRPEMQDYLIGPNAGRVVRHAPQSVFVVRD